MASASTTSLPNGSQAMPSPSVAGLKNALSNARRSSEAQSDGGAPPPRLGSVDSLHLDKSPTRKSTRSSPSRDGSSKSGSSGVRKLLPGHNKRRRRKLREEEMRNAAEDVARGRTASASLESRPLPLSRKASSLGSNSLLTDDEEGESAPPLVSPDSHQGYLTTSSPLITSSTVPELNEAAYENNQTLPHAQTIPSLVEPQNPESSPSPKSPPLTDVPSLPSPGLIDKADTLKPETRRGSISKIRNKSPARKFRDVFSSKSKSPRGSPERKPVGGFTSPLSRSSIVLTADTEEGPSPPPKPVPAESAKAAPKSMPSLDTDARPLTPPTALISTPVTTVTPPTPTDTRFDVPESPQRSDTDLSNTTGKGPNIVVSPSGNMISHRRVRSTSSVSHQPSKLSNSVAAPLTPAIEEVRTPSGSSIAAGNARTASGNFFSSWMSAAQNAATTFTTNLAAQNRSRAGTTTSEPSQSGVEPIKEESEADELDSPRKQLAVETMGTGDLNFEHLGLEHGATPVKPSLTELRHDSVVARDVAAAKAEDVLAKRAVSAAYERINDATPVAEIPDPLNSLAHTATFNNMAGQSTPPNGSILESEAASVKRNNSVRSKITAKRRSRGSSIATGQSAIGALIGGSTATLANPATGPRLSGFSMAPKQRNRTFHQQFRSVPEDDYLVEDYSCALQKEILLAGRIYISEGHICFSSNILGWVTTLVISFEEVVNLEKENTALVIPNAIAIQTLHARHTFRSLLSRESTYDLLIGIWKVSHPASFQKSIVGKQLVAEEATKDATGTGASDKGSEKASEGSTEEDSDDDGSDGSAPSVIGSGASFAGSEMVDTKTLSRKPSGMNGLAPAPVPGAVTNSEIASTVTAAQGTGETPQDFPGPTTHAPTECTDSATHYDIIIKDEVLPAPLGKIYSLLYGPQSNTFVRKFLVDECKSLDLQLEDDKKGLSNEKKTRQYTYIKPLGGSIGPKQTRCITTEDLDFFDLEKAVTVSCSTQTPDVPSGNAFLTKTRYCLTWAAGNATRFQMNCTIEWSAKSWLKGPIEKGAKDGQQQYGDSLVKAIKSQVGRARGMTSTSKVSKSKKKGKRSKRDKAGAENAEEIKREENWGLLEPLRGYLGPVVDVARPALKMEYAVGVLFFMVLLMWFSKPRTGALGPYAGLNTGQKMAAYEEMWRKEESELWGWLEQRAGVDAVTLRKANRPQSEKEEKKEQKVKQKQRQKVLKGKEVEARLREEKISEREMEEALRITRERLEVLEGVIQKKRTSSGR